MRRQPEASLLIRSQSLLRWPLPNHRPPLPQRGPITRRSKVSLRPGAFLKNIALFFFGFLPTVAIVSMVLIEALGDRVHTSPDWEIGWNPILWFIMTAPWLVPIVVIVPLLYFLAKIVTRRSSRSVARCVLLGATPALFLVAILIINGPDNFSWEFALPVGVSGLLFGAIQRIPDYPASPRQPSPPEREAEPPR